MPDERRAAKTGKHLRNVARSMPQELRLRSLHSMNRNALGVQVGDVFLDADFWAGKCRVFGVDEISKYLQAACPCPGRHSAFISSKSTKKDTAILTSVGNLWFAPWKR